MFQQVPRLLPKAWHTTYQDSFPPGGKTQILSNTFLLPTHTIVQFLSHSLGAQFSHYALRVDSQQVYPGLNYTIQKGLEHHF